MWCNLQLISFNFYLIYIVSQDEFSSNVQQWNDVRRECVDLAYRKLLMPEMIKELRRNLLAESKEHILKACKHKLANWLAVSLYIHWLLFICVFI